MRIFFLGDTHADLRFTLAAIDVAAREGAEAIVQVGDFGLWDHIQAGVDFLDGVDARLGERGLWLIFVDGNHECFERLYDPAIYPIDHETGFRPIRSRILHAPRGLTWGMGDLNFLALGGASSIDGPDGPPWFPQARDLGNGWWPDERISEADVGVAMDAASLVPIDVMVTHDCPIEVAIPGINKTYPAAQRSRDAISEAMGYAQPQLLICGHYHRRHSAQAGGTRVEILAHNESEGGGQYLIIETDPFTLLQEAT